VRNFSKKDAFPRIGNSAGAFWGVGERVFRRSHGRTAAGTGGLPAGGSYHGETIRQNPQNLMDSWVPMMLKDVA